MPWQVTAIHDNIPSWFRLDKIDKGLFFMCAIWIRYYQVKMQRPFQLKDHQSIEMAGQSIFVHLAVFH